MSLQDQKAPDRIAALTEIWREVLANPALDENSDLFDNDGSSLHVLQITGRIHDVLGINVKLRHVFSNTSPRSLSDFLESEGRASSGADDANS
ncbi:fengycin family lipopeptide synthetase D [Streptomyces griseochromogenes]|uniref:Fengycin family lipopeptide synthetase D n=1 Tax=Streptomyces griseochromogenes TaxID=68214 RepID=A0A1B1AZT0_9ACTN|nr:phosphopantetheine-binding protein [Streptomyces griseochromogenes]ANP52050.1 peptide synthetase Nrp (peptide synthase) [Streptomyces griseochromogenes]MBP2056264.1 fengycin family lipopeptide synthetase D [Streptomyces griseochromogenes]